jgi:hypothetical protein
LILYQETEKQSVARENEWIAPRAAQEEEEEEEEEEDLTDKADTHQVVRTRYT